MIARLLAAGLVACIAVSMVLAGPEWREDEDGGTDAGSVPLDSQPTDGDGGLLRIAGQLGGLEAPAFGPGGPTPDDFEDVYLICIDDPAAFRASTFDVDGFTEFDARLYLFDLHGNGILGNNTPPASALAGTGATADDALLVSAATDQTGSQVLTTGLYLLAITTAPQTPTSGGDPIFFFESPDEISGPDGPGAGGPLDAWGPATGACCLPDGSCASATTAAACAVAGGLYQGDDASCEDVTCPDPVGACCLEDGGCVEVTEVDCLEGFNGAYEGDQTLCDETDCPQPPTGACVVFLEGEVGCMVLPEPVCADLGGQYAGDDTDCSPPDNDLCQDALPVTAGDYAFSTIYAETDGPRHPNVIDCESSETAHDVWYSFETAVCGDLSVSTCNQANFNTTLTVYDSCNCPVSFGEIIACGIGGEGCDDNTTSLTDIPVEPGCYTIRVSGFEPGDLGFGTLSVGFEPDSCPESATATRLPVIGAASGHAESVGDGAPRVAALGGNTPEPDGEYRILLQGVCFSTDVPIGACDLPDGSCAETTEFVCVADDGVWLGEGTTCDSDLRSMYFKKDACPAPVNPGSNGVLKAVLVGEPDFDVHDIDLDSLALSRTDGVGGQALPNPPPPGLHIKVKDLSGPQPFNGTCSCEGDTEADGIDDLEIPFRASQLAAALDLGDLEPGTTLTLALTGVLSDGTPFESRDCMMIAEDVPAALNGGLSPASTTAPAVGGGR